MSTLNHQVVARRLTRDRLDSYLQAVGGSVAAAIDLYDWNTRAGSALHEDLGRFEVLFRNAIDDALVRHGSAKGWQNPWYRQGHLFQGRQSYRTRADISEARRRATRRGRTEAHGKVIAELGFGFWRYLCGSQYLTSLWVPALASAFAGTHRRMIRTRSELTWRTEPNVSTCSATGSHITSRSTSAT